MPEAGSVLRIVEDYYTGQLPFVAQGLAVMLGTALAMVAYLYLAAGPRRSLKAAFLRFFPPSMYRHPSTRIDFFTFIVNRMVWGPVLTIVTTLVAVEGVQNYLTNLGSARDPILENMALIVVIQVLVLYVAREFVEYVSHYCDHRFSLLWSFHRVHHSAEELTFFTFARAHPVAGLIHLVWAGLSGGMVGGALYLMGTPLHPTAAAAWAGFTWIAIVTTYLAHSHVRLSLGRLNYIFTAPVMHQIHHSAELHHRDRNFGGTLMIFDWMFGTLYIPGRDESYRWGLNDDELGANNPHSTLRDFYIEPIQYFLKTLKSSVSVTAMWPIGNRNQADARNQGASVNVAQHPLPSEAAESCQANAILD